MGIKNPTKSRGFDDCYNTDRLSLLRTSVRCCWRLHTSQNIHIRAEYRVLSPFHYQVVHSILHRYWLFFCVVYVNQSFPLIEAIPVITHPHYQWVFSFSLWNSILLIVISVSSCWSLVNFSSHNFVVVHLLIIKLYLYPKVFYRFFCWLVHGVIRKGSKEYHTSLLNYFIRRGPLKMNTSV